MENNYLLNGFTELQKKIMPTMADCFYRYRCREGVYTNELICELMERHGLGPREWQGSLVGLGKKDYIHTEMDGIPLTARFSGSKNL